MEKERYKSRFGDIYYELSQIDRKPMIVFTHGVGMDHKTFDAQVAAIKSDFGTMVWDLPGHGNSTLKNYNQRFTALSAACLNDLLESKGVKEAYFVGQSLGSMIVQQLQIKNPEKVKGTIHVPGIELKPHVGPWARRFVPVMMGMLNLIPSKLFYSSFGKHRSVKKEVQEYLAVSISKIGKKLALAITEDMVHDLIEESPVVKKAPLLITYGDKDLFFIKSAAKKWHKRSPYSQCIEIRNANHIVNQDNPEAFNRVLIDFF